MQVDDEIRKCVVFVAYRTKSETKLAGTAFLVGVPLQNSDRFASYVVTAKHTLDAIRPRSIDGITLIRVNLENNQGVKLIEVPIGHWIAHPTSDVAALAINWTDAIDHLFVTSDMFASLSVLQEMAIGIGDDIFVTGLFTQHVGSEKNLPILRSGNIAAMPEEPVKTKKFGKMRAYLVECRSIGGLSGSPVFVQLGPIRKTPKGGPLRFIGSRFALLGLMHGHWNFPADGDAPLSDGVFDDEKLNVGIGVVVPADTILELLNLPVFLASRAQLRPDETAID